MLKTIDFENTFEKYGMRLYADSERNSSVSKHSIDIEDLEKRTAQFVKDYTTAVIDISSLEKRKNQFIKDYVISEIIFERYCKIIDLDLWKSFCGITNSNFYFPDEYLLAMDFYFDAPAFKKNTIVLETSFSSITDFSIAMNKPVDMIRKELCINFELHSLFHPKEAENRADEEIEDKIFQFNNSLNISSTEQLKDDLLNYIDIPIKEEEKSLKI